MRTRLAAAVVAATALAACDGGDRARGTATLWVTRDSGASLLVEARVAAGQSAMQALDRETELETRYGGRYVHAVNGVEGSLRRGVDWFYFVNGYEADRSAVEYRLRNGDVVWFDFRRWREQISQPVVVGSFPQPFLGGFDGKTRAAVVAYDPGMRRVASRLAARIHARAVRCCRAIDPEANVLRVASPRRAGDELFVARHRGGTGPGAPVEFLLVAAPGRGAAVVRAARHRFAWERSSR